MQGWNGRRGEWCGLFENRIAFVGMVCCMWGGYLVNMYMCGFYGVCFNIPIKRPIEIKTRNE